MQALAVKFLLVDRRKKDERAGNWGVEVARTRSAELEASPLIALTKVG